MVLLPSLVLGAEIEGTGVLQVRGQHNGLVASLARHLDAEVPSIERDEDEFEVLGRQVFGSECIDASDSVPKGTGISNMLPGQGSQTRCERIEISKTRLVIFSGRIGTELEVSREFAAWWTAGRI